ncbi:hypothetical protein FUA26_14895 [Seonamhaeicola algicola]|uniref:LPXTG cell wall anchor domain-containing protein n=1 Tax=Seonamhaeicola algicola TaxID=1719036 RepID=A0A5C7ACF5_9FLAO|nr:hypothetical protein [Seonamhaeicola algicola]TXE06258.1 hypothetical protein FUA26_14895 [Seonamhaeicola algicola]
MKTKNYSVSKILTSLMVVIALTFSTNIYAKKDNKGNNGKGNADGTTTGSNKGDHGENTGNQGNDKQKGNTNKKTPSAPLDGGLGILVLGAAAFGYKKLRNK